MIWQPPKIEEGKLTQWNWMVQGVENFKLGKNTDIGAFVYIQARAGVTIEDDVQIGGGVKIYSINTIDKTHGLITISRNACIGANSVILPNVFIGENSIVAAGSVILGQTFINDNEIWAGSPAKKIGLIQNGKRIYT